jgi:hypothetical protein
MDVALDALTRVVAVASGHEPDFQRTPDQVLRQAWRHLAEDARAVRAVGVGATAKVAASRLVGGAGGLVRSARGWFASRR